MEGVNSLLIDLLSIIEIWLKIDSKSSLNFQQFCLIIDFLNPQFITQSIMVINCIIAALERNSDPLETGTIYCLIKAMFRSLLLVESGENGAKFINKIFELQEKIFLTISDTKLITVTDLHMSIGLWMSCLATEHKNPEIGFFFLNFL